MSYSVNIIDGKAVRGGVIRKPYPTSLTKEIYISDGLFVISGEVNVGSFWAYMTIEELFADGIDGFTIINGQYQIYGYSSHGSPSFAEDGCTQDNCVCDCNSCSKAQREKKHYTLPIGVIISKLS